MKSMKKVLVIEDDSFLVEVYATKFKKAGYKTILVTNGEEGLVKAESDKPDIILLDLMLPKKNGFEVLAELKANPKLKKIPVVVLSNLGQEKDIEQVKQLGADDYLIKSNVTMKKIIKRIDNILRPGHYHKIKKDLPVKKPHKIKKAKMSVEEEYQRLLAEKEPKKHKKHKKSRHKIIKPKKFTAEREPMSQPIIKKHKKIIKQESDEE